MRKAPFIVDETIQSRLLGGLDAQELRDILGAARELRLPAGSVIFDQTHSAERMFLLTYGRARHFLNTHDGKRILLHWLVPGDITGGRALMTHPIHYLLSAETLKDSRFMVWDQATLHRLTTRYPELLRNVLLIADDYLRWFLTAHTALTCFTARRRCAAVLTSIAMTIGQQVEKGIEVEITNEELADASATTLFEASRFLSNWRRVGIIQKKRGRILVRSMDLLSREIRK